MIIRNINNIEYNTHPIYENKRIIKRIIYNNESPQTIYDLHYATNNLIIWYDGINNTGEGHDNSANVWKDISGNNNHSVGGVSVSWNENSFIGNGSNSAITLPAIVNDTIATRSFTCELRIKATDLLGRDILFGNYSTADSDKSFNIERNSGTWADGCIRIYYKSISDFRFTESYTGTDTVSVTITCNNGLIKCYINGILCNMGKLSDQPIDPSVTTFYLGRDSRTGSTCFKGNMYLFRLYNRPLHAEEISRNYLLDNEQYKQMLEPSNIMINKSNINKIITLTESESYSFDGYNSDIESNVGEDKSFKMS